jgi:hypothetical protein
MVTVDEELMTEENYKLVGEWEPIIFNEFAISLTYLKKDK